MSRRAGRVAMFVAVLALCATAYWLATRDGTKQPATPGAPTGTETHRPSRVVKTGAATTTDEPLHSDVGTLQLEGQVVDADLRPVAGAQVTLLLDKPRQATSEVDGSYSFSNLAPGPYRLVAHKDAMSSKLTRARLSATSDPVTLRLEPGATLVVKVLAADRGSPIAGATVADRARSVLTGTDGIAKLGGMDEFATIEITASGYSPATFQLNKPEEPLGTIERTVKLSRGALLAGTVVGPDGALIPDATVNVRGAVSEWSGSATTDAKGAWSIPILSADKYAITATSEIFAATQPFIVELDGSTPRTNVVVRVAVGAQIVGTVVDANGRPFAGAKVTLAADRQSFDDTTGIDGRFAFLGTPAGAFWIWATTATQASSRVEVQLVNDQRIEVHLILADSSVAGTVVDSKGEPIAEAVVHATAGLWAGRIPPELTDAKGAFDFGGLPAGEYELVGVRPEQRDASPRLDGTIINAPDRAVKLVLPDVSSITGRVMLDGQPMTYFGLIVTDHPEFSWQASPLAVRSPDGRFTHTGVAPGKWGVLVGGPGVARKVLENVEVTEGKVTDLGDIVLDRGQRISGHVTTKAGAPVAGATVEVNEGFAFLAETPLKLSMQGHITVVTDASGAYQIHGIWKESRLNQITATHPTLGSSGTKTLSPSLTTLDLVVVPVGGIDGAIVGGSERVDHVQVVQLDGGVALPLVARVDATSAFKLDNLLPGHYDVSVFGGPGKATPPPMRVTVVANKRTPVTLSMAATTVTLAVHYAADCQVVTVMLPGEGHDDLANAFCDDKGNAVIEGLMPGTYRVCPTVETCATVTVTPTPPRQTVEIPVPK